MNKSLVTLLIGLVSFYCTLAQNNSVSIGTTTTKDKAILWLKNSGGQGLILPSVTTTERNAMALNNSDEKGMIVFDNILNQVFYWNGLDWLSVSGGGSSSGGTSTGIQISGNTIQLGGTGSASISAIAPSGVPGQLLMWNGTTWVVTSSSGAAPALNQVLTWNGTNWAPQSLGTGGTVTNVSGTAPVTVVTGTSTPVISMAQANATTDGYLAKTDFSAFSGKVSLGGDLSGNATAPTVAKIQGTSISATAPTSNQVLQFNGTAWTPATLATVGGTVTSVTGTAPISVLTGTTTPVISIAQASGTANGYLSSTDYTAFSGKVSLGGDLGGTASTPLVSKIQGVSVSSTAPTSNQVLQYNGTTWTPATLSAGSGSVTSVGLSLPSIFSVTGSPITTSGTLTGTLASQTANTIFAAPNGSAGAPTFRTLVAADLPTTTVAKGGTGLTTAPTNGQLLIGNGTGYALGTLTQGTGINITNGTGTITIAANAGVNPNQLVQLDGTGKLPAVDGSQLTNIPSGTVADGSITGGTAGTGVKIAASTITDANISSSAAIAGSKVNPSFGAQNISTSGTLNTGAITTTNLASINTVGYTWPNTQGTANTVLTNNGTGTLTWAASSGLSSTLPIGQMFVGNASNVATAAPLTGDAALNFNLGNAILTIGTGAINSTKIADGAIADIDVSGTAAIAGTKITPAFGTQNISTTGTLSTGAVTATNLASINTVAYSWPNTQGAVGTVLTNNGTGTLTWGPSANFSTNNIVPRGNGTTLVSSAIQDDGTNTAIGGTVDATSKLAVTTTAQDKAITTTNSRAGTATNYGLRSSAISSTTNNYGIYSEGNGANGIGVVGTSFGGTKSTGVQGIINTGGNTSATNIGTEGYVAATPAGSTNYGLSGSALGPGTANYGASVKATSATTNYGIYAEASGGTNNWAGYFKGNVSIENGLAVGVSSSYGTSGQVLTSQGAGVAPIWSSAGVGWSLSGNSLGASDFLGSTNSQPLRFSTANIERMRIDAAGKVGIGTTAPIADFSVVKQNANVNGAIFAYSSTATHAPNFYVIRSRGTETTPTAVQNGDNMGTIGFIGETGSGISEPSASIDVTALENFTGSAQGAEMAFSTIGIGQATPSKRMVIDGSGNIGIGISAPTAKLEINGQIKITGGAPGVGKVLTSDVNGLATWQSSSSGWGLGGNTGTVDGAIGTGTNYIGTQDNVPLNFIVNNFKSGRIDPSGPTFFGYKAGSSNSNSFSTGIGNQALELNTTGAENTAVGYSTLAVNVNGSYNVAIGKSSLTSNVNGFRNVAVGANALSSNVAGESSTAIGTNAMQNANNSSSFFTSYNTAVGFEALKGSASPAANTGTANTAIGYQTLAANSSGVFNSALGNQVLLQNTTGSRNLGAGFSTLFFNTTGSENTALGSETLAQNVAGSGSTAVGTYAMQYANNSSTPFTTSNVAVGYQALRGSTTASANTGTQNTAVGYQSLLNNTTGFANVAIGVEALTTNTSGNFNTAVGLQALQVNSSGINNASFGKESLKSNTTGGNNNGFGLWSLYSNTTGGNNVGVGTEALYGNTTGFNNTAIGHKANVASGNLLNATAIGAFAYVSTSNSLVLGGINGVNGSTTDTNVGIGTTSPTAKLEVAGGDIKVSGEVQRPSTGNANLIPIAYGYIAGGGSIISSTGNMTSSNPSTGTYNITVSGETISSTGYFAIVTPVGGSGFGVTAKVQANAGGYDVYLRDTQGGSGNTINNDFYIVIYKL